MPLESLIEFGYYGLFVASFLAATVVPLSSEFVFIGLLAAGANPIIATVVATVGNTLGGATGYGIGYLGKWEWLERYFKIKEEHLLKWEQKVKRYGTTIAFFAWLPAIGDIIPIALGFFRAKCWKVMLFMFLGKAFRYAIWAYLTVKGVELFVG